MTCPMAMKCLKELPTCNYCLSRSVHIPNYALDKQDVESIQDEIADILERHTNRAYDRAAEVAEFSHVPPCCGPTIAKDIRRLKGGL